MSANRNLRLLSLSDLQANARALEAELRRTVRVMLDLPARSDLPLSTHERQLTVLFACRDELIRERQRYAAELKHRADQTVRRPQPSRFVPRHRMPLPLEQRVFL